MTKHRSYAKAVNNGGRTAGPASSSGGRDGDRDRDRRPDLFPEYEGQGQDRDFCLRCGRYACAGQGGAEYGWPCRYQSGCSFCGALGLHQSHECPQLEDVCRTRRGWRDNLDLRASSKEMAGVLGEPWGDQGRRRRGRSASPRRETRGSSFERPPVSPVGTGPEAPSSLPTQGAAVAPSMSPEMFAAMGAMMRGYMGAPQPIMQPLAMAVPAPPPQHQKRAASPAKKATPKKAPQKTPGQLKDEQERQAAAQRRAEEKAKNKAEHEKRMAEAHEAAQKRKDEKAAEASRRQAEQAQAHRELNTAAQEAFNTFLAQFVREFGNFAIDDHIAHTHGAARFSLTQMRERLEDIARRFLEQSDVRVASFFKKDEGKKDDDQMEQ